MDARHSFEVPGIKANWENWNVKLCWVYIHSVVIQCTTLTQCV